MSVAVISREQGNGSANYRRIQPAGGQRKRIAKMSAVKRPQTARRFRGKRLQEVCKTRGFKQGNCTQVWPQEMITF